MSTRFRKFCVPKKSPKIIVACKMMPRGLHYFFGQHYNQHFPIFLTELIFSKTTKKVRILVCLGLPDCATFCSQPRLCRFTIAFHIVNAAALLLQEGNTSVFWTKTRTFYSSFWKISVRWKKYESYVPSVARKNSVHLQMSKHTQLLFQEIFCDRNFRKMYSPISGSETCTCKNTRIRSS